MIRREAADWLRMWWEYRPDRGGVIVLTAAMVLCREAADLPLWAAIALPLAGMAVWMGLFAWLDASNAAADAKSEGEGEDGELADADPEGGEAR